MEKTLYTQLLAAQIDFPKIKKDATNPFFKNRYASLDGILEDILPILHKHGLFLVQNPITEGERIGVHTQIYHSSGECIESSFTMVLAKNDPQGAGSAISYARRYSIVSMLGLNLDDDDGNNASNQVVKTNVHNQGYTPVAATMTVQNMNPESLDVNQIVPGGEITIKNKIRR